MHQLVTIILLLFCGLTTAEAQTYTEHVQTQQTGRGNVTIHQSKEIEKLVNGKRSATKVTGGGATDGPKDVKVATAPLTKNDSIRNGQKPGRKEAQPDSVRKERPREAKHDSTRTEQREADRKETERRETARKAETTEKTGLEDTGMDIPTVDMRKKVMRRSYKVTGYRVQAYAGGNSREDRIKAEKIGSNIKMKFPDEPVYVHFYSPRWICRVGNYRTFEEADRMLQHLKGMGYKQACIVRGKITVQY